MFFRNRLLLCVPVVTVSGRNKLFMQNLITANINLVKNILSYFFQALLPSKVTFASSENVFFSESFIIFCLVEIVFCFVRSFSSAVGNHGWNLGESILTGKYFSASGNHIRSFCQKKQFFRIAETYFSTNPSFQLVEKYFLFSENRLIYLGVLPY